MSRVAHICRRDRLVCPQGHVLFGHHLPAGGSSLAVCQFRRGGEQRCGEHVLALALSASSLAIVTRLTLEEYARVLAWDGELSDVLEAIGCLVAGGVTMPEPSSTGEIAYLEYLLARDFSRLRAEDFLAVKKP